MRKLSVLNVRDVKHLCRHLGTNVKELSYICRCTGKYYKQGKRNIKGKIRLISTPKGRLREILDKLQILLQRISLPDCIHGGRKGHSNITNALPHINKPIVLNLDLKDFFPNLTNRRIYNLFLKQLGCSPDVSRYLTRLTTLNGSLPQGSPTSTILAALATEPLAKRLENLAKIHHADYTQYVDDITASGMKQVKFITPTIKKIIRQEGFFVNHTKTKEQINSNEQIVTGVRVNQCLDVPSEKVKSVRKHIDRITTQTNLGVKPSSSELASVKGKIHNVMQLNKGAGRFLLRRLNKAIN